MAIALVARTVKVGTGATVANDAINVTGANLLLALCCSYQNAQAVSDNKGNVYTGLTERLWLGSDRRIRLFYCLNPITDPSLVVTATGGGFPSIGVAAFSGVKVSGAFDQEAGGGITNVGFSPGLITPSADNALMIAGICTSGDPGNMQINSSYDLLWGPGASGMGVGLAYKTVSPASAQSPSFTWTNNAGIAALHTSFLAQPPASPPHSPRFSPRYSPRFSPRIA